MKTRKRKNITKLGDKFGMLTVIRELGNIPNKNGESVYYSLCKCDCGNEVKIRNGSLFSGNSQSCGCIAMRNLINRNFKHGLANHPLYDVWHNIKMRCYNPIYNCYHRYGGRGIKMYEQWINNLEKFIEYCSKLDNYNTEGYSIDRINNNGDYEPGNIRFASPHEQALNQDRKPAPNNKYIGVLPEKGTSKFVAHICINNKNISIGWFASEDDAVRARNEFIIKNNLIGYKIQNIIC